MYCMSMQCNAGEIKTCTCVHTNPLPRELAKCSKFQVCVAQGLRTGSVPP
jgi:hypothetical protein